MFFLWLIALLLLLAGLYLLLIAPADHHPDTSDLEGWLYAPSSSWRVCTR